jgi:G protein-coupled receptor 157
MLTTWLIFTDRLGHSPYTEAAWCGLIINNDTQPYGFPDLFAAIIGYDIWIYTTVALCSGIYVALFMYMHFMYEEARGLVGNRVFWKRALQFLDIKLIFIPIVFIFLKMWSSILLFLFYYCRVSPDNLPNPISQILIYFSGIGDSGQGFANGILFVFLTPIVRQKFILRFFNICKRKKPEVPDEQTSLVKKKIEYSPCASITSSGVHSESEMN